MLIKQRNCSKFTEEFRPEKGDNMDKDYKYDTIYIKEIWEGLNRNIKSIIKRY